MIVCIIMIQIYKYMTNKKNICNKFIDVVIIHKYNTVNQIKNIHIQDFKKYLAIYFFYLTILVTFVL